MQGRGNVAPGNRRAAAAGSSGAPARRRTLAREPGDVCVISLAAGPTTELTPVSVALRHRAAALADRLAVAL